MVDLPVRVDPEQLQAGQAAAAGLDPAEVAGHSLRSGGATTAAERGAGDLALMKQSRWKSVTMVKRNVQQGQALGANNASRYLGL